MCHIYWDGSSCILILLLLNEEGINLLRYQSYDSLLYVCLYVSIFLCSFFWWGWGEVRATLFCKFGNIHYFHYFFFLKYTSMLIEYFHNTIREEIQLFHLIDIKIKHLNKCLVWTQCVFHKRIGLKKSVWNR